MHLLQPLCGLQLHQHQSFDKQIGHELADYAVFVPYLDGVLLLYRKTGLPKFKGERVLVHLLDWLDW